MKLWYSVFEFMSNRLAEKRTNFFGIPSSSKPIILQRSRLSIRIVLHSSSHLLLLFYFFFFVGVCKAITPSLRFIFCVVFCENWKGITRQIFWYFHFIFLSVGWNACQVLILSSFSWFSRGFGKYGLLNVFPFDCKTLLWKVLVNCPKQSHFSTLDGIP